MCRYHRNEKGRASHKAFASVQESDAVFPFSIRKALIHVEYLRFPVWIVQIPVVVEALRMKQLYVAAVAQDSRLKRARHRVNQLSAEDVKMNSNADYAEVVGNSSHSQ